MSHLLQCIIFVLSCGLSIVSAACQPSSAVDIAFELNAQDNMIFSAVLNKVEPLNLMFHTAASEVTLTAAAVKKLTSIEFHGVEDVSTWGGNFPSRYSLNNHLQIQSFHGEGMKLWENNNSGEDSDGKFGFDFFPQQVVEIDFENLRMRIHDKSPEIPQDFQRLPLHVHETMLMVECTGKYGDKLIPHRFLIHSGYGGGILLDDEFVSEHDLNKRVRISKSSQLSDSAGNVIEVKSGELPEFQLGSLALQGAPVGFFEGKIGAQQQSVIGCKILKQFHWFFDLERQVVHVARRVNK